MSPGNAVYQAAMSGFKQFPNPNMLQLQQQQYNKMVLASGVRARGRAVLPGQRFPGMVSSFPTTLPNQTSGGKISNLRSKCKIISCFNYYFYNR